MSTRRNRDSSRILFPSLSLSRIDSVHEANQKEEEEKNRDFNGRGKREISVPSLADYRQAAIVIYFR